MKDFIKALIVIIIFLFFVSLDPFAEGAEKGNSYCVLPALKTETVPTDGDFPMFVRLPERKRDEWKPSDEDVEYLSKMAYGEARGCGYDGIRAVMECALNRLEDGRWGDTVKDVITYPCQFYGYKSYHPVTDEIKEIAVEVLTDRHNGVEPSISRKYLFFTGDGKINRFREA